MSIWVVTYSGQFSYCIFLIVLQKLSKFSKILKKKELIKRGVIRDPNIHERICNNYEDWFSIDCKMKVLGITPSPIKGPKGNVEFLITVKFQK